MSHPAPRSIVPASRAPRPIPPANGADSGRDPLPSGPLANYQRLAIRVIQQALRDLDCASPGLRDSARLFFDGGPLLSLWCDVADIGPSRVMARAGLSASVAGLPQRRPHDPLYDSTPIARLATARASVS